MKRLNITLLSLILLSALLADWSIATPFVIDEFTKTQNLTRFSKGVVLSTTVGDGILGGERDLVLNVRDSSGDPPLSAIITIGNGILDFSTGSTTEASLLVVWDGIDNDPIRHDPAGLDPIDFYGMGLSAFNIEVLEADHTAHSGLYIFVGTEYPDGSIGASFLDLDIFPAPPVQSYNLPFDQFLPLLPKPADFRRITGIGLQISGVRAFDMRISSVGTTPEPTTMILFLLGIFIFVIYATTRRA